MQNEAGEKTKGNQKVRSMSALKTAMMDKSKTYAKIAEEFGIDKSTVNYHAKVWGIRRRVWGPVDDSLIIRKYINEQKSLGRTSVETGYCEPRVRKRLAELGLLRTSSETHHMRALNRAREHGSPYVLGSGGYPIVPVDPATIRTGRKLTARNRYAFLHVLEAEKKIGRLLVEKEVVHHIDFDRLNASPDNLAICSSLKEHNEVHGSLEKVCGILYKNGVLGFTGGRYFVRTQAMEKLLSPNP